MSSYSEHKAKASAINQTFPPSKRAGSPTSILKHYAHLRSNLKMYISPRECTIQMVENDVRLRQQPDHSRVVEGGSDCSYLQTFLDILVRLIN